MEGAFQLRLTWCDQAGLSPGPSHHKAWDISPLRAADKVVESTLAPAALLAERFGLLPSGTDAVELDTLLAYFYRLPRLPKLSGPQVLRQALEEGVQNGLFGLASGSSPEAEDAVLRFREPVELSEIQFQPGTWLVRAAAIKELLAKRGRVLAETQTPIGSSSSAQVRDNLMERGDDEPETEKVQVAKSTLSAVKLHLPQVPGTKMRDVVKVAVLPLTAVSPDGTVELLIRADGGLDGIPRETLNLTVLEGLRQLGFADVEVEMREAT